MFISILKKYLVNKYFYSLEEFINNLILIYEIKPDDVYVRTAF